MDAPRLSIFIPTRNEVKYIGRTLAQLEPFWDKYNLEIIISDANSNDGTIAIVQEYIDRSKGRVRLVTAGPGKQNIAIGCNLGAFQARAPLLFRIDADVLLPQKERFFEKIFAKFEKEPGMVGATVPIWVYPQEERIADRLFHFFMNGVIQLSFFFRIPLAKGECQFVRRAAFEQVGGYDERLTAGEDCNLFYRLQSVGKVRFIPDLVVHHSPRRFRHYGYWRILLIYFREGIWMALGKKSFLDEWKPVR